jgi:hypothetical protein
MNEIDRIERVWRQNRIPVIYREGAGRLLLRLPYSDDNRDWLRSSKQRKPQWNSENKYWEILMAWFNDVVNRALHRWKVIYVIQPYRDQEKCAPACWHAVGHECQCSCVGANHGSQTAEAWLVCCLRNVCNQMGLKRTGLSIVARCWLTPCMQMLEINVSC